MHQPPAAPVVYSLPTADDVVTALAQFVIRSQHEAIEKKGRFTIALSGGSQPKMLRGLIGAPGIQWDKWYVTLGGKCRQTRLACGSQVSLMILTL